MAPVARASWFLILAGCALGKGFFTNNPYIVSIGGSKSVESLVGNSTWAVNFYAPWCPHCRHFRPTWERVAKRCAVTRRVTIGAVDCVAHRDICNVKGYPTIRLYRDGNVTELPRADKDLLKWADEACGQRPLDLGSDSAVEQMGAVEAPLRAAEIAPFSDRIADAIRAAVFTLDNNVPDSVTASGIRDIRSFLRILTTFSGEIGPAFGRLESSLSGAGDALTRAGVSTPLRTWRRVYGLWRRDNIDILSRVSKHQYDDVLVGSVDRGVSAGQGDYIACPGYTCAIWQLLHAATINCGWPDHPSMSMCHEGVVGFVRTLFPCHECRDNFLNRHRDWKDHARSDEAINDGKDPEILHAIAMWLWNAHNEVTARVHPGRPLWPTRDQCAGCRNDDERFSPHVVLVYLHQQYCSKNAPCQAFLAPKGSALGGNFMAVARFIVGAGKYAAIILAIVLCGSFGTSPIRRSVGNTIACLRGRFRKTVSAIAPSAVHKMC